MACSVCHAVTMNCANCGDLLKKDFFCFNNVEGDYHFCDGMCFDIWIVDENKKQLKEAHDHKEQQ